MRLARVLLFTSAPVMAQQAWFMESSAMLLEPSNRHVSTVVATNPTEHPIFLRTSASALRVRDGRRERGPDVDQVLSIYPAEFVLQPNSSFAVRVVADARKLEGVSRSFYVSLRDVSDLATQGQGSALAHSTLLTHEVLVAVGAGNAGAVAADAFELRRHAQGHWLLVNRSGQHVYLQRGYGCEDARGPLNTCRTLGTFPRQSMMVDEAIRIPPPDAPFLGVQLQPSLQAHSRPQALFVQVPP